MKQQVIVAAPADLIRKVISAAAKGRKTVQTLNLGLWPAIQFDRAAALAAPKTMSTLLLAQLMILAATIFTSHAELSPSAIRVLDGNRRPLADGHTVCCGDNQKFAVTVAIAQRPPPSSKWRVAASVDQSGISCAPFYPPIEPLSHSTQLRQYWRDRRLDFISGFAFAASSAALFAL